MIIIIIIMRMIQTSSKLHMYDTQSPTPAHAQAHVTTQKSFRMSRPSTRWYPTLHV